MMGGELFGFERRRKSTGVAKNGIGLFQLPVGVGGALRVGLSRCGDGWEGAKTGNATLIFGKNRGGRGIRKAAKKRLMLNF